MSEQRGANLTPLEHKRYLAPSPENDLMVHPVTARDWSRVRGRVAAIKQPSTMWSTSAGVCAGLAITAFATASTFLAQPHLEIEATAFFGVGGIGVVGCALCGLAHRKLGQHVGADVGSVLHDMDEVVPPEATALANVGETAQRLEGALSTTPSQDADRMLEEVRQLKLDIQQLSKRLPRARPRTAAPGTDTRLPETWRDPRLPQAWHDLGEKSVTLTLRPGALGAFETESYTCVVTRSDGSTHHAIKRSAPSPGEGVFRVIVASAVYPDDFDGADALVKGSYRVAWYEHPTGSSALAQAAAGKGREAIATDKFEI